MSGTDLNYSPQYYGNDGYDPESQNNSTYLEQDLNDSGQLNYLSRNSHGILECSLCGTTHQSKSAYMIHTTCNTHKVKLRHFLNRLSLIREKELGAMPSNDGGSVDLLPNNSKKTSIRPEYSIYKEKVKGGGAIRYIFECELPKLKDGDVPRYRVTRKNERNKEEEGYLFVHVRAPPYTPVVFRVPRFHIKKERDVLSRFDPVEKFLSLEVLIDPQNGECHGYDESSSDTHVDHNASRNTYRSRGVAREGESSCVSEVFMDDSLILPANSRAPMSTASFSTDDNNLSFQTLQSHSSRRLRAPLRSVSPSQHLLPLQQVSPPTPYKRKTPAPAPSRDSAPQSQKVRALSSGYATSHTKERDQSTANRKGDKSPPSGRTTTAEGRIQTLPPKQTTTYREKDQSIPPRRTTSPRERVQPPLHGHNVSTKRKQTSSKRKTSHEHIPESKQTQKRHNPGPLSSHDRGDNTNHKERMDKKDKNSKYPQGQIIYTKTRGPVAKYYDISGETVLPSESSVYLTDGSYDERWNVYVDERKERYRGEPHPRDDSNDRHERKKYHGGRHYSPSGGLYGREGYVDNERLSSRHANGRVAGSPRGESYAHQLRRGNYSPRDYYRPGNYYADRSTGGGIGGSVHPYSKWEDRGEIYDRPEGKYAPMYRNEFIRSVSPQPFSYRGARMLSYGGIPRPISPRYAF